VCVCVCVCVCVRERDREKDKNVTEHHQNDIVRAAALFDNRQTFRSSCTKFIILATLAELTAYRRPTLT
jgi:Holliday junction resolvase-like predicted endonuclease